MPAITAFVRKDQGWFGGLPAAPDLPMDRTVLTDENFHRYTSSLERNGFFGPDSWYMNAERNIAFAREATGDGRISLPVLFLHAAYDYICATVDTRLAEPMREHCRDLTEATVASGHWIGQEKPMEVNAALGAGSRSSFRSCVRDSAISRASRAKPRRTSGRSVRCPPVGQSSQGSSLFCPSGITTF